MFLKHKKLFILFFIVSVVSNAIFAFLLVSENTTKAMKPGKVCGEDIISTYNNHHSNISTTAEIAENMIKEIKDKKDNEQDPNCIMMVCNLHYIAYNNEEYEKCSQKILELSEKGLNPSIKIRTVTIEDTPKIVEEHNTEEE